MSLVEIVRNAVDQRCIEQRCEEGKCNVPVTGMPPKRCIVHLESSHAPIDQSRSHCDYLVAYDYIKPSNSGLIALELKPTIDISKAAEQLQEGARIADCLSDPESVSAFVPVVAGKLHPHQRRDLAKHKIRFRGVSYLIIDIKCGDPLDKVLSVEEASPPSQRRPRPKRRPSRRRS